MYVDQTLWNPALRKKLTKPYPGGLLNPDSKQDIGCQIMQLKTLQTFWEKITCAQKDCH